MDSVSSLLSWRYRGEQSLQWHLHVHKHTETHTDTYIQSADRNRTGQKNCNQGQSQQKVFECGHSSVDCVFWSLQMTRNRKISCSCKVLLKARRSCPSLASFTEAAYKLQWQISEKCTLHLFCATEDTFCTAWGVIKPPSVRLREELVSADLHRLNKWCLIKAKI